MGRYTTWNHGETRHNRMEFVPAWGKGGFCFPRKRERPPKTLDCRKCQRRGNRKK